MKQTGTDYERLLSVLQEVWDDGAFCGGPDTIRRDFVCMEKLLELTRFLDIMIDENGEIVSIAGKEIAHG